MDPDLFEGRDDLAAAIERRRRMRRLFFIAILLLVFEFVLRRIPSRSGPQ